MNILTEEQKKQLSNKMLNKYVYPNTEKQIHTLITNFKSPKIFYRLCTLLAKFSGKSFHTDVYFALKKTNDIEIFESLMRNIKLESHEYDKSFLASYYVNLITIYKKDIRNYLDIGCGNCQLTDAIGKKLNANIYGADIEQEFEVGWKNDRPDSVHFIVIKDNRIIIDKKFDLISTIMVLHHIDPKYVKNYIEQIYDLLNDDGYFLVKEHDCYNSADYMIADIEHSLYIAQTDFIKNKSRKLSSNAKKTIKEQVIYYKNKYEWQDLIISCGFELINENIFDVSLYNAFSPDRSYVALFKKL